MPKKKPRKPKKLKSVLDTSLKCTKLILLKLLELGELYVGAFANPTGFVHEQPAKVLPPSYYQRAIKRMAAQGWIKESHKQGKKFIKLTKKGKLQVLLQKLKTNTTSKTLKGGWQLIIFDIPEVGSRERRLLRDFLKAIDFCQLQKSVYISPYEIAAEAIDYLRESGLIKYLRFLHVDRIDNDANLRRIFRLK